MNQSLHTIRRKIAWSRQHKVNGSAGAGSTFSLLCMLAAIAFLAPVTLAQTAPATQPAQSPTSSAWLQAHRAQSKVFRAAVEKVRPSMVWIETYGELAMPAAGSPRPGTPAPRGRPQRQPMGISRPGEGPTTGLIVSPQGHILTSTFNFIRRQQIITVVLHDGTQHVAKLLGRDDTRKLCLLKIQVDRPLPVPTWVDPATLQVGQWAISVGLGYGEDQPALSVGIISGLNRIFGKAVQTDANISPANYGGPLLDYQGRVIGICVPLSPQSTDLAAGVEWYDSGIGFAIPVHGEPTWLAALQRNEHLQPGRMGVQITPAPVVGGGVHVRSVLPKSAAQQADLRPGDLILAVDDHPLDDPADLRAALGRKLAGDTIRLRLRRDAKELTVNLTLESGHEEPATPPTTQPATQPDTQPDNTP